MNKLDIKTVNKIMMFTDIHWGNHHDSTENNDDCTKFVDWFIIKAKEQKVDAIAFLGDWFQQRNHISTLTAKYSNDALRKLNALGIPVFFIIGNHDLYHRHNREVHGADMFKELSNVILIEEPLSVGNKLFLPWLFKEEYADIAPEINKHEFVFGHLEFRNFYLTGTSRVSEVGFHHKLLDGPKTIFSGHFHCRQATDNICYIGNPFGTSFGDAGDYARGCCLLAGDKIDFFDYVGPTYLKTSLSELLSEKVVPRLEARVHCLVDDNISYSEAQNLKKEFVELYKLREFVLEENKKEQQQALAETILEELEELDLSCLDETVKKLIETGVQATTIIFPDQLISIYGELN